MRSGPTLAVACRSMRGLVRGRPLRGGRMPSGAGGHVPETGVRRLRADFCCGRRGGQLRGGRRRRTPGTHSALPG